MQCCIELGLTGVKISRELKHDFVIHFNTSKDPSGVDVNISDLAFGFQHHHRERENVLYETN